MKEDNPRVIREFKQEKPTNISIRDLLNPRLANDSRVAYKESHEYTKNTFFSYFWAFSDFGVFWKVLAIRNTLPMV